MENLKIEYLPLAALTPYEKNTRKHQDFDVGQIAESIRKFGFDDPIGIWGPKNIIVEGHGRLLAAKKLRMKEVPCIRLDHLTDEERRQYAIAHNKTAELSEWDFDLLSAELEALDFSDFDFDFSSAIDAASADVELPTPPQEQENPYTMNIDAPVYQITGEQPKLAELVDHDKVDQLLSQIRKADVPQDIKEFLSCAAQRHLRFDYAKIAEYYAHADERTQELFEQSALVIVDFNSAIKNGFTKLSHRIEEMRDGEEE